MKETIISYMVDWGDSDAFYENNLAGTSLLTVAEEMAKKETKNQVTRYIHRHTLKVIKILKVEDQPQETTIGKHPCKFEGCKEGSHLGNTGDSDLCAYCWLHASIVWAGKFERDLIYRNEGRKYSLNGAITKPKALKLIKELVNIYPILSGYGSPALDKARDSINGMLVSAGVNTTSSFGLNVYDTSDVKQLCFILREGASLE